MSKTKLAYRRNGERLAVCALCGQRLPTRHRVVQITSQVAHERCVRRQMGSTGG